MKEIRLLPMSKKQEFPNMSYEQIQQHFFRKALAARRGYYYFRKVGLSAPVGSLVLFQVDGFIIASAILEKIESFEIPQDGLYNGAFVFDPVSICTFTPITAVELSAIDPSFKAFSQVKQKLDVTKWTEIVALIESKRQITLLEDLSASETASYVEGAKHQIIVNAYERSDEARQKCIDLMGSTCVICGFDFGKIYGQDFAGKIHIHHTKPLCEINKEYVVNPETDLVPVCPNCHMILHSKIGGVYTVEEVKRMIKNNTKKVLHIQD
ncbi:MAG: hypothetical protein RR769_06015 [Anaerovoracaceae bacterium]